MPSSSSSGSSGGGYEPIPGPGTGFCLVAEIRVGNNSSASSPHEFAIGRDTQSNNTKAENTWDADLTDGLDSGPYTAGIIAPPGGGQTNPPLLTIGAGAPQTITYSGVTYGEIKKVQIQARVATAEARFSFASIQVKFESPAGQDVVNIPDNSAPVASTLGGIGTSAQQTIQVTPAGGGFTQVTVTCIVRLECAQTQLPGSADIAGAVYVFADNCAAA